MDNIRSKLIVLFQISKYVDEQECIINQKGVDVAAAEKYWSKRVDKVQVRKYLTWGYTEHKSADPTPYLPLEERIPCPWLFERLNIDSRGDVTLCGEDIAFSEKFANVMEKTIKEIWHGPEFNHFREKHLSGHGDEIPICSTCPDWQYRSWQNICCMPTMQRKRIAVRCSGGCRTVTSG